MTNLSPHLPPPNVKCARHLNKILHALKTLSKFTMGSRNLDALLAQQKCMFNKEGIGYTFDKKQKSFKIFFNFVKASSTPFKHVTISCIRVIPLKIV